MSSEGYAALAAFANTRIVAGSVPPQIDRSYTGVNAMLMPFEVLLTRPPRPDGSQPEPEWQAGAALVGLDNLDADANPRRLVRNDYGPDYDWSVEPRIKPDPDAPAPESPSPSPSYEVKNQPRPA